MQLIQANIWEYADKLDYVCITTNSVIKQNGELVMGAGNALQAKQRVPTLPLDFGNQIKSKNLQGKFYGLLLSHEKYLAFQTKLHYQDESPLDVVSKSVSALERLANKYPDKTFGLPFPAISNGKRTVAEILPMLETLPNNVYVYHLDKLNLGV